ncbi:reverse transcriptase domain-containing protein, partial [Bacillus atrophaeus]|uniref:reverse transcriptase domain-containing protein n=1 Tax=Bacillus atrophaeus TaxID=1452 RepID=UPI0022809C12
TENIDFSNKNMQVYYSGYLDLGFSKKQITENARYNESYKLFQKEQKIYRGKPALKIDIKDFFNSIKVKELIKTIKYLLGNIKYVNNLEEILEYCGFDYLPQFHYSIASSILSQFYLTNFDNKIRELLVRENLQLIRYVDDMYIIFLDGIEDRKRNNAILNEISYYLWEHSLVLNTSKTEMLSVSQYQVITESLSENYEDGNYKGFSSGSLIENKALEIVEGGYLNLIVDTLCNIEEDYGIDLKKYKELMEKYIAINGGEVNKIWNNIIFSEKWKKLDTKELIGLIKNWEYIFFNPNQFTVLYLMIYRHLEKSGLVNDNGLRIREVLNYLFKNETFTLRDTLVAISYLFQRNLKHKDLIQKIKGVNQEYVDFIQSFITD